MVRRPQFAGGLTLMLAICCLAASSSAAAATTRWVNDDDPNGGLYAPPGTSCNDPGYPTIQSAVNASVSGDRINVCPGTYLEEVTIPAGKDNLLLRSVQFWAAFIKAPPVMLGLTKSIVRVNGARGVTILAFTITGPGGTGCDSLRYGVRVDGGGSADILGNHITHIHDTPFSGCQNGVAVLVGRAAESTTGSARVLGNVIDTYQKNGPTVSNTGSSAEIAFNRILGIGPTALIAQNGIQASSGATASIRHNFVADNIYTPQTFTSTGMLLFQSGQVNIGDNTVTSNDVGVYVFDTSAASTSAHNRVRASTFDGIVLDIATSNRVAYNKTDQNNGPGIGVYDASQNNALEANLVVGNTDSGILLDDGDSNSIAQNHVTKNGTGSGDTTDGIRVNILSSGNTLSDNHLNRNVTHDCHDNSVGSGTAGTANFWIGNEGQASKPPGLCREDDDNDANRFESSTTFGWNANYAWYLDATSPIEAAEYDWPAAYATIDTATLLQLLPQIRLGVARATMNPFE